MNEKKISKIIKLEKAQTALEIAEESLRSAVWELQTTDCKEETENLRSAEFSVDIALRVCHEAIQKILSEAKQ